MLGMTSVTFRKLSTEQIIDLVAQCELDGIEWGGDVHVPAGDAALAQRVGEQTRKAGLTVLSYGSYHRLCEGQDFAPVLQSAQALGAPMIRIWAGTRSSSQADDAYFAQAAQELSTLCEQAAAAGIRIGLEYHRNTLTDTGDTALRLLTMAKGATCYWQPNPDLPTQEHFREIALLGGYLSNVHVFCWTKGNVRHPLREGTDIWRQYFAKLREQNPSFNAILEFVENDSVDAFRDDANTLKELLR